MYEWIWRHLPFGLPGKIIGSLLLVSAVVALLWFKVFGLVEPLLPNTDGQVTDSGTSTGDGVVPAPTPGGSSTTGPGDPGVRPSSTIVSTAVVSTRPRSAQPSRSR